MTGRREQGLVLGWQARCQFWKGLNDSEKTGEILLPLASPACIIHVGPHLALQDVFHGGDLPFVSEDFSGSGTRNEALIARISLNLNPKVRIRAGYIEAVGKGFDYHFQRSGSKRHSIHVARCDNDIDIQVHDGLDTGVDGRPTNQAIVRIGFRKYAEKLLEGSCLARLLRRIRSSR